MDYLFTEKYFINQGIDVGIKNYIKFKSTGEYNRAHTFEMHVIKALCTIYGESSILLPYKIDNEKAFKCNLLMYDFKEKDMELFISLMQEYFTYIKNIGVERKPTGLVAKIEYLLIEMINCRGRKHEYADYEIKAFESIFNPTAGDLKKLKTLVTKDCGLIAAEWNKHKEALSNTQVRLLTENPTLLDPYEYELYGLDIKEVANLSNERIAEINRRIALEKEAYHQENKKKKRPSYNIVLTSGNGFVDKLMLLSIVMTEIMVGLIIAAHLGG